MKNLFAITLLAMAPAVVLAQAQATAPKSPAKNASSAAAKKSSAAKAAAKPRAKTTAKADDKVLVAKAQPSRTKAVAVGAVAAGAVGAAGVAAAGLTQQELSIAEQVHVGHIPCELGASVNVTADANAPGHFHVDGKGFKYHMAPVATTTGAVRLEDQKAGAVWLQIANKSMLMDQKRGQRLADECMSPAQYQVAQAIKKNPPPSVLDALPNNAR
ncbi:hypothetical protein [Simplicispira metamorpha]|uniref:Uncharacterized protein n=1 Tax=Simplicispira metamorpha TaxID=80881 RepID=A0A4V2SKM8_9BURK|nr:hypothetical protein [Simplicispira metamorpha]TCP20146.1 hypothetical protein EV674_102114 [Simplicispira metamorpha]